MTKELIRLTEPIRKAYDQDKDWQKVTLEAYPPPPKKEKVKKDRGIFFPGTKDKKGRKAEAAAEAKADQGQEQVVGSGGNYVEADKQVEMVIRTKEETDVKQ